MLIVAMMLFLFGSAMLVMNVWNMMKQPPRDDTFSPKESFILPRFYRLKH